jgi:hypothetical protein
MKQDDAPEMLDRGANSAFLKAIDIRGSEDSGQVRVLREGLKALRGGVSFGKGKTRERPHSAAEGVLKTQGQECYGARMVNDLTYALNVAGWGQGERSGFQLGLWREQLKSDIVDRSSGSKVAPIAVEDYWNINSALRRGSRHSLSLKELG